MAKQQSSWKTTSGLLDGQEGLIEEAWWATSVDVQDGKVLLLHFKVLAEDGEEHELKYTCGDGWESVDGGKTAHDEKGNAGRLFHKRSNVGLLIDLLVGDEDKPGPKVMPKEIKGLGLADLLSKRGEAYEAKTYEGLRFFWEALELDYGINRETKEPMVTEKTFPTKFLGIGEEGAKVGKRDAAKKVKGDERDPQPSDADEKAAKIQAAKDAAKAKANGGGQTLRDQLVAIAKESGTHAEFIDQAMEVDGVIDDEDLMAEIVEETGLFAEARA